jgi:hypothetical protein
MLGQDGVLLPEYMVYKASHFIKAGPLEQQEMTYSRSMYDAFIPTLFKAEQKKLSLIGSCLAYFPTLKMDVICSSETSGCLLTTWCYNPEDHTFQFVLFVGTKMTTGSAVKWPDPEDSWSFDRK